MHSNTQKAVASYIALGSNLGDRQGNINNAVELLKNSNGITIEAVSHFAESNPLGGLKQPDYLNAVLKVITTLDPFDLLEVLQDIETASGRQKKEKWSSRTIDLDIILYNSRVINDDHLQVPHKQMHLRSFVLDRLCEIEPDLVHPLLNRTVRELAKRLGGNNYIISKDSVKLISVAGLIGVGKTTLAKAVADCLGSGVILEDYETNPYLSQVYAGCREKALDSELFFLKSSVSQLDKENFESGCIAVNDYIFDKAFVYAGQWLDEDQMKIYRQYYEEMASKVAKPVIVVYLEDSIENCLDRIHNRRRPYEQDIDTDFLLRQKQLYDDLFREWNHCPVFRINAAECDGRKMSDVENLCKEIKFYIEE